MRYKLPPPFYQHGTTGAVGKTAGYLHQRIWNRWRNNALMRITGWILVYHSTWNSFSERFGKTGTRRECGENPRCVFRFWNNGTTGFWTGATLHRDVTRTWLYSVRWYEWSSSSVLGFMLVDQRRRRIAPARDVVLIDWTGKGQGKYPSMVPTPWLEAHLQRLRCDSGSCRWKES